MKKKIVIGLLFLTIFAVQAPNVMAVDICTGTSTFCTYLKQKEAEGLAAGNDGDYYVNCDGGHARLSTTNWPRVQTFDAAFGANRSVYPDKVVVGNASIAYTSMLSEPGVIRWDFMRSSSQAMAVYNQYRDNDMFWYPEHRDHDADDRLNGMNPAVTYSQGSSGSEKDELAKIFWTLAAFRPEAKAKLKQQGLLIPAVQMIMRRTRVASDEEYLSGKAHYNAYDNFENTQAMMEMANGISPDNVPPMVQLKMVEDDYSESLAEFKDQRIYDSPVSISRIWNGLSYKKHMRVSAKDSFDANGRQITFHWAVLRGDPAHVRINYLNENKSEIEVEIDYHNEAPFLHGAVTRTSNLVVIGCFVNNGAYYSAPGFVTSYTLPNEKRTYNEKTGLVTEINYEIRTPYVSYDKAWNQDIFNYSESSLQGWWRRELEQIDAFTFDGFYVSERDESNRVTKVKDVYYSTKTGRIRDWEAPFDSKIYSNSSTMPVSPDDREDPTANSDLNEDSSVNVIDLGILMSDFGKSAQEAFNPRSDINADGAVNVVDLGIMMSEWGS